MVVDEAERHSREGEQPSERSDAGVMIVEEVFDFVKLSVRKLLFLSVFPVTQSRPLSAKRRIASSPMGTRNY